MFIWDQRIVIWEEQIQAKTQIVFPQYRRGGQGSKGRKEDGGRYFIGAGWGEVRFVPHGLA